MGLKKLFYVLPFGLLLYSITGCKNNNRQSLLVCDTINTKFASVINPVIIEKCISCHSNSAAPSSGGDLSLEGYDNVKANYSNILSAMKAGTMPKGGDPVDMCTISKIETWVGRGAQNN